MTSKKVDCSCATGTRRNHAAMNHARITERKTDFRLVHLRGAFPSWNWQPEVQVTRGRKWRFDYASRVHSVAVEIEGGVFGRGKPCPACGRKRGGAHSSVTGMLRDIEKYNEATAQGWRVLRFTPEQFAKFEYVERLLKSVGL